MTMTARGKIKIFDDGTITCNDLLIARILFDEHGDIETVSPAGCQAPIPYNRQRSAKAAGKKNITKFYDLNYILTHLDELAAERENRLKDNLKKKHYF